MPLLPRLCQQRIQLLAQKPLAVVRCQQDFNRRLHAVSSLVRPFRRAVRHDCPTAVPHSRLQRPGIPADDRFAAAAKAPAAPCAGPSPVSRGLPSRSPYSCRKRPMSTLRRYSCRSVRVVGMHHRRIGAVGQPVTRIQKRRGNEHVPHWSAADGEIRPPPHRRSGGRPSRRPKDDMPVSPAPAGPLRSPDLALCRVAVVLHRSHIGPCIRLGELTAAGGRDALIRKGLEQMLNVAFIRRRASCVRNSTNSPAVCRRAASRVPAVGQTGRGERT